MSEFKPYPVSPVRAGPAVMLAYQSPQLRKMDWRLAAILGVLEIFGWAGVAWVGAGILCTLCGLIFGGGGAVMAAILLTSGLVAGARGMKNVRQARGAAVLMYVHSAVRLNLPLATYLAAAATAEPLMTRARLRQVSARLEEGAGVSEALTRSVPEIDDRTLGRIRAGEASGQLGVALARAADEFRPQAWRPGQGSGSALVPLYLVAMPVALFVLVTGLMIFVVPKYQEIFRDFRTQLPWATQVLIDVSRWVAEDFGWLVFLPLPLLAFAYLGFNLMKIVRQRHFAAWPREWTDALVWYTPLAGGVVRARNLADVCDVLADALTAGMPAPAALEHAAQLEVNGILRRRLGEWWRLVDTGTPLGAAAASAGLPRMVSQMAAAADGTPGMADVFGFLGRYYRMRFSRGAVLLRSVVEPAVVLVMGTLVGTVVVALFLPLVKLINAVSGAGEVF